ncbi:MAG: right-handed parallel beta-helix repeat-containing protein [Muribaculaceae bacterium]|nr:right-handed parallel beta-helix repeat-containing protein [Muribaculaceae bacterium]
MNKSFRIIVFLLALTIYSSVNARSPFQDAVDSIAALERGGTLVVPAGIHVTGTLQLKSGVNLHLKKGAVILGSINPYDYDGYLETSDDFANGVADKCSKPQFGLIVARDAHNISITGEGTIDGRGLELALAIDSLHHIGERVDPNYNRRRMRPSLRPKLLDFENVDSLTVTDVLLRASASWGFSLNKCNDVLIKNIDFVNRAYWNNDGIDVADCHNVLISGCDINSADDGIVLKSFDPDDGNENIVITDCRIASSANAIKMGTESFGGFRNIIIKNIKIRDTFRSAIALESVDGAVLDNVSIDSIEAKNTGNAFFIRLGHRRGEKPGSLTNVEISNLSCEIPFGRPDSDYDLRGPDINTIHNPFPASITGIPGHRVENVKLSNIY